MIKAPLLRGPDLADRSFHVEPHSLLPLSPLLLFFFLTSRSEETDRCLVSRLCDYVDPSVPFFFSSK